MKKLIILFVAALPLLSAAQESAVQQDSAVQLESTVQQEFAGLAQYEANKIISLAEAIPEAAFTWSPEEEVRNTGQVLLHIAAADYFLGSRLGVEVPEGVNPRSLEETIVGKENIIAALKQGIDFAIAAGINLKDENLSDSVQLPFGEPFTKRGVLMLIISHNSEHLGQLIAYARMNGITPPWSVKEGDE